MSISGVISLIVGCLSIGVILSAPMGPVGVLCVQRTLNNGRASGFYTGIGAAASDLFYCLLVGLGLSMVTNFIKENQFLLQIIGSLALIVYAVYMILHNPVSAITDRSDVHDNHWRDMVTGFLFTLSNPLIVFLIFILFGRFTFPTPMWFLNIIGFCAIVGGALLWWAVITYFVNKVRSHFNIRSMWLINRIMGGIILVISLYGIISGLYQWLQ